MVINTNKMERVRNNAQRMRHNLDRALLYADRCVGLSGSDTALKDVSLTIKEHLNNAVIGNQMLVKIASDKIEALV